MLETLGIQFPDNLVTLDSDMIMRKSRVFVNSSAEKILKKPIFEAKTHWEEYRIDFRLSYSN